ncbi:hypothetical protein Gogos_010704 [Gossypium gossypioides]|uniref:Uncharacterized protein n=1 Tax=Gossypium gossypioides TaxID=34282 RepID=A0A7J9BM70_GOSGO|nr:hypothetical protein [Gossypium gossypioides]
MAANENLHVHGGKRSNNKVWIREDDTLDIRDTARGPLKTGCRMYALSIVDMAMLKTCLMVTNLNIEDELKSSKNQQPTMKEVNQKVETENFGS